MNVSPGRYTMRGGGVAMVTEKRTAEPTARRWYFWLGKDEETGCAMTWMPDGRWAAFGQHPNDLISLIPPDA